MKEDTKDSIDRYVQQRVPTGSFLQAVLSNDLRGALGQADEDNRRDLFEIVAYCYNEIPGVCWGSPEKVDQWLATPQDKRNAQVREQARYDEDVAEKADA